MRGDHLTSGTVLTAPGEPADGWHGWAAITAGRLYYGGRVGTGGLHTHHAVQLLVGHGLVLRGSDGVAHEMAAALIPANTPHAIVRGAAAGLLALIDPAQATTLSHRSAATSAASWSVGVHPPNRCDLPSLAALVDEVMGAAPPPQPHPALAHAMRIVEETLPGLVRLSAVADAAHLSESRLAHLFKQETGLPFRPYVLWARLRVALTALSHGTSLTDAAHAAGFSDAAHLTRTVRRMMGDAPSALAAGVRWLHG
ncbi:helix-turn-helix transcriptional regulator [Nonomuraea rubra]